MKADVLSASIRVIRVVSFFRLTILFAMV